jgi:hypothetical protein
MTCCAIARCNNPDCQVCTTVERGFPKAVIRDFTKRETRRSTPDQPAGDLFGESTPERKHG